MAEDKDPPFTSEDPTLHEQPTEAPSYIGKPQPSVSSTQGRKTLVFMAIAFVVAFGIYKMFTAGEETVVTTEQAQVPSGEKLTPPPPTPVTPTMPPPPLPQPTAPLIETTPEGLTFQEPTDEQRQARLRSNMLIGKSFDEQVGNAVPGAKEKPKDADPNALFAEGVMNTQAEHAVATKIARLDTTIAQGKFIDTVLETAINTDMPGSIRAIVSRDIYAEAGRGVLVPKGSRVIGTYNSGILQGQKRVFIIWTRIIRPDGVDIAVNSAGIDQLGRGGIDGKVDNRYMEIFGGAILTSAVLIGMGYGADQISGDTRTVTQNTDGSRTTQETATQAAAMQAVQQMGATTQGVVNRIMNTKPTISVGQGTRVKIFVNRDLIFPDSVLGNTEIIQ